MTPPLHPLIPLRVPLILASASPRRTELLQRIGLPHRVVVSPFEETLPEEVEAPEHLVEHLAMQKALPVARQFPESLVLAADTIVVLDHHIMGKPRDAEEAVRMLRRLSDHTHTVYTGIALAHADSGRTVTAHESTRVRFAPLSDEEIQTYVATGSPFDKAGAYGIQDDLGALFVCRIEGDYYNVVGLPLHRMYRTIRTYFSDLFVQSDVSASG